MPIRVPIVLLLLCGACATKKYKGKDVCEVLTDQDMEAVMGEPFKKGVRTGLLDDSEDYVGSYCDYESVARSSRAPDLPKARVNVEAAYIEPAKADIGSTRKEWEAAAYNGKPFYTNIHDVPGIADASLAATDYNGSYQLYVLLKPATKVEVRVDSVLASQAEERGVLIARKMIGIISSGGALR